MEVNEFMKDELNFLRNKIVVLETIIGCPHQCIICAPDAPNIIKMMDWKTLTNVVGAILAIKDNKGIDIMGKNILPFFASDSVFYKSGPPKDQKTIFDIAKIINESLDRKFLLTIAGWDPKTRYVQGAMKKLVEYMKINRIRHGICYSVKTVAASTIKEYRLMVEMHGKDTAIKKFIEGSKHYNNLISNMKTLKGTRTSYQIQHVGSDNLEKINEEYAKIGELFAHDTVFRLFKNAMKDVYGDDRIYLLHKTLLRSKEGCSIVIYPTKRGFTGEGRAKSVLGIEPKKDIMPAEWYMENGKSNLYPSISIDGKIKIMTGRSSLWANQIYVPKEYFMEKADQCEKSKKEQAFYTMLANLQDKPLFLR